MLSEEMLLLIACLGAVGLLIFALLEVLWPSRRRHARGRYPGARPARLRADGYRSELAGSESPGPRGAPAVPTARPAPSTRRPDRSARPVEAVEEPALAPGETPAGVVGGSGGARDGVEDAPPTAFDGAVRPEGVDATAERPVREDFGGRPEPASAAADGDGSVRAGDAVEMAPALPAAVGSPAPIPATPVAPAATAATPVPLEECFAMYQEKRYAEVIAAATPAVERFGREGAGRGRPSHETAALWSILGLARQALNDEDGARAAFEEAIRVAPAPERAAYRRHLAALAQMAARKLIARAEVLPDTTGDERITMLKNAVLWLRQGLACAPEDPDLLQALERSRKGLWVSYGHLATAFIQRQEFHGARRLIREILAEEDVPEDRREAFRDLLAATFSGEIGQLTAHAIRTMQDEHERDALTSLERAERLLSSIPDEALSPTRREEVNRRLWWGYTKLGVRRLESGEYEDALAPLFRALRFGEVDGDRQQETRTALVRALEGATTARVEAIDQLLKTGKREAATAEGQRLRTLLREGLDVGLSAGDLTSVLATSRRVLDEVQTGS